MSSLCASIAAAAENGSGIPAYRLMQQLRAVGFAFAPGFNETRSGIVNELWRRAKLGNDLMRLLEDLYGSYGGYRARDVSNPRFIAERSLERASSREEFPEYHARVVASFDRLEKAIEESVRLGHDAPFRAILATLPS